MAKHDQRGRSKTKGRFALVPDDVMCSPSYLATSMAARALLLEIARLYMGANNGWLGLSVRQASERLGCSKDTASRAFHELQRHGLIEPMHRGHFDAKAAPKASEWRLAWQRCDRSHHLPSHGYRNWEPDPDAEPERPKTKAGPTGRTVRSDRKDSGREIAA
jgi:hypothetical protein